MNRPVTALLLGISLLPSSCRSNDDDESYAKARKSMVEMQLRGPGRNIRNERVLKAMGTVCRHEFVPENLRDRAYDDRPLPIGHGQTISQPYIVAFMTEKLDPQPNDRVLEIGTGSGYQTAVLAELVEEVHSIEIVKPLAEGAKATLEKLCYNNVTVRAGDGYRGWKERAPFDAVIVTCAPDHIPDALIEQLREGGKMIIPVGEQNQVQHLHLLKKIDGRIRKVSVLPVRFVPMIRDQKSSQP